MLILLASVVLSPAADAAPFGLQARLHAVVGHGYGMVLGAPTAADHGTFVAQITITLHGASANATYQVSRAVDLNPDGVCTLDSGWLVNGPLQTSETGAGTAHFVVHRGPPFVSGTRFDVEFRVLGDDGSELRTGCSTVTVK